MLTVTSCQKDDAPLEAVQEGPEFIVEKLTGSQLTSNRSLNKALRSAKEALGINELNKSVYDSINNLWIDDNQVNHVSSGTYESFTFGVFDPIDSLNTKNIVFHKLIDSTYLPILLSYELNQIDSTQSAIKYKILNSNTVLDNLSKSDAGGLLDILPCNMRPSDCLCWRIIGYGDEGEIIRQIEVQNGCSWESSDSDTTISDGDTNGGGNTSGNNNPPNDTNPGNTTPGGGQSGGTPAGDGTNINDTVEPCDNQLTLSDGSCAGIITVPTLPSAEEILADQLDDLIEDTEDEWEFDSTIDPNNSLHFETVEEFDNWKANLIIDPRGQGNNQSDPPTLRPDGRFDCTARRSGPVSSIEVDFIYTTTSLGTLDTSEVDEDSIVSSFVGLTTGVDWEERSIEVQNDAPYTLIKVKVTVVYAIGIENFSLKYSDNLSVIVVVGKTNAEVLNIYLTD